MTTQVTVRLTEADVAALDVAVARGSFTNRSDALRSGLERILYEERQREIDQLYAADYGKHPQEARVGELGLAGFSAFDRGEGGAPL
jgi:Arc/MetJ-type ribon-helix-helix transcriptional regulator